MSAVPPIAMSAAVRSGATIVLAVSMSGAVIAAPILCFSAFSAIAHLPCFAPGEVVPP